jgi:hypothetical protein
MMEDLISLKDELDPVRLLGTVLDKSGYLKKLKEEKTIENRSRIENLEELEEAIREQAGEEEDFSIEAFLERAALMSEGDKLGDQEERLTLMTLHGAKGLEFPVVFMAGMEENLFPHSRSKDDPEGLEEERRLCYVGMTRAMERLYLSHADRRRVFGSDQHNLPSRYLSDIPEGLTKNLNIVPDFAPYSAIRHLYSCRGIRPSRVVWRGQVLMNRVLQRGKRREATTRATRCAIPHLLKGWFVEEKGRATRPRSLCIFRGLA